jgi:hypothetical protein
LKFSVRDGILRISSKRGDSLNAVFCPPENEPQKNELQFRADKSKLPAHTDLFITNVEKRQKLNEKDSFKGQVKHPQIPYINLFVSNPNDKHSPVMLRAMHDSGCAKSVMHKDIFESIPGYKDILVRELKNVFVKSCSGEQERISGHVSLKFSFEGDNGNIVSFIHDVLITDFIQHPLLLGRDFTGSSAKLLETNSHLFLSDSDKNFENLNEMLTSPKVADVPIISHFTKKLPISNLQEALIPPQTLVSLTCKLSHNDPRFFLKQKKELVMAAVNTVLHSHLKTPDTLLTFYDFQNIQIPFFNSSSEDIQLPANFELATLDILDEFTDIYHLNVTLDEHQSLEINSAQEIIQNDESLDDNEKEEAFMEYLQSGKYT